MARKKSGKPENNIIPFNQTGSLSDDDLMDDDFFDEDDEDGVDEEMVNQLMSTLLSGMMGGGMTNEQYKGMLLDSLQPWKDVLQLAQEGDTQRIIQKAKAQISLINRKLRF